MVRYEKLFLQITVANSDRFGIYIGNIFYLV